MYEAALYEQLDQGRVQCHLCAHHCTISPGRHGLCQVRLNEQGRLYSLVYGQAVSVGVDPIEKKPLYHFYPGAQAFSVGTPGCNFRCGWCQNADISQRPRERAMPLTRELPPAQIVDQARRTGCHIIAYTYNEPTIFYEYARDTARLARQAGMANVFVTNGFMSERMLADIDGWLDAANVDLKSFSDKVYRDHVGARLDPVLRNLNILKQMGVWLEVTTLLIPGLNDGAEELTELAGFIADRLGAATPWHISRFFPAFEWTDTPPTSLDNMHKALQIGERAGLRNIYLGNVGSESNLLCSNCGRPLIRRGGYGLLQNNITSDQACPNCGQPVAGVGMAGLDAEAT